MPHKQPFRYPRSTAFTVDSVGRSSVMSAEPVVCLSAASPPPAFLDYIDTDATASSVQAKTNAPVQPDPRSCTDPVL